jgi:hypothetical protein
VGSEDKQYSNDAEICVSGYFVARGASYFVACILRSFNRLYRLYQGAKKNYPLMCGWLYVEVKKNKWQKRFCEIKTNAIYHAKDAKVRAL